MRWLTKLPWDHIREAAIEYDIPMNMLAAIVMTESSGNPHAVRFEENYKYVVNPKKYARDLQITVMTETLMQQCSWGLIQIMGGTARECGFDGPLSSLTNPDLGLKYGCIYLRKLLTRYPDQHDAIASYNAGSPIKELDGNYRNKAYVSKVTGLMAELSQGGL